MIAVVLTNTLIRDYLLNYARPLIYTTSLSYTNIIAAGCAFDLLEDGTAETVRFLISPVFPLNDTSSIPQLAKQLLDLSSYFTSLLRTRLLTSSIPPAVLSLPPHLISTSPHPQFPLFSPHALLSHSPPPLPPPSPIIPLHTTLARPLSVHLLALGMNARPITWPTVPKGKDRVRVCLHAGNTKEDVERLVEGVVGWARAEVQEKQRGMDRMGNEQDVRMAGSGEVMVESKL